ncbi:MAG: AAA family ATPase [Deltaproteobacteria bacterium]|nr:AAA family ATPase [Kofleriaceae bacterium]
MTRIFQTLRAELVSAFPERQSVIDGALCAIIAGEHVLLLGPPGTGKSALVRSIAQAFGGQYFERLLTRFSTPEELFGPVSLSALEQDRYVRVTAGKLPEAEIAFVDEVFKANSAILNSLLAIANERVFHNDGVPTACPLVSLFAASNELPESNELEALFDRFLLRYDVGYLVQTSSFRSVVKAPDPAPATRATMDDLHAAQLEVLAVKITDGTIDAMIAIRDACRAEGIVASDRRWKRSLRVARAAAYLAGEKQTSPEDLSLLADSLWREPKERAKVARIVGQLADPAGTQAQEILDAARETAERVSGLKTGDRKAYISAAAGAIDAYAQQQQRLTELALKGGRRARTVVAGASAEIDAIHRELAQAVSAGLGLRGAR